MNFLFLSTRFIYLLFKQALQAILLRKKCGVFFFSQRLLQDANGREFCHCEEILREALHPHCPSWFKFVRFFCRCLINVRVLVWGSEEEVCARTRKLRKRVLSRRGFRANVRPHERPLKAHEAWMERRCPGLSLPLSTGNQDCDLGDLKSGIID